jgi:predicted amidohydrolase YtcJ
MMRTPSPAALALSLTLAVALALTTACRSKERRDEPGPLGQATLFYDGRIYLGSPDWEPVEAVLVREGRVVATGPVERLTQMAASKSLNRVSLGGGVAVPGLQDAHGHLEGYGAALETVDLRGAASYAEVVERVAAAAAEVPAGTWIQGRGWDQNLWEDTSFPEHGPLSERVPDHPAFLRRVDGHAALVNARALEIAGLDGGGLDPHPVEGGQVLLDEEGRAAGVLVDAAMGLVAAYLESPDEATRVRRLLLAQDALLADGLTAVHDMGVSVSTVLLLEQLRSEGRLKLRLVEYLSGGKGLSAAMLEGFPLPPDSEDRLTVIGVKLYADGALGSRGAALLDEYADDPGNLGLMMASPEELAARVSICAAAGLQPAVHAIGDRGNRAVLDAYEEELSRNPDFALLRPRIEHAQVVAPADWGRFEALGVVPSMQPTHCTSDMPWAPARLGEERVAGAYAWRRLAPDTSVLAFGSDFPVEDPDPLEGLFAAVTRQTVDGQPQGGFPEPIHRLSMEEALGAFTLGAARAAHQEDRRGRLAPGYFADLTVIDRDPFEVPPEELLRARVLMTVVNGEVVFTEGGGGS